MSRRNASRALEDRFQAIRRSEMERLAGKLRGLSDDHRRLVEAITADLVQTIASVPARVLADEVPERAIDALVRLFALEGV